MKLTRLRSLFARMLLAHLVPGLGLLALFGWLIHREAERSIEQSLGLRLVGLAQAIATDVRPDVFAFLAPGDDESRTAKRLRAKLRNVQQRTGLTRVFIIDGRLRSRSDTDGAIHIGDRYYHAEADRGELTRVFAGEATSSVLFAGRDGQLYKSGYAPLRDGERVIGALGVEGSAKDFDALRSLRAYLLLAGLGVGALMVLLTLVVARRITSPLRQLADDAQRIGTGELERPVNVVSHDEVGLLAATMNQMRLGLLERDAQTQLMLAGIAHEVRNPLAGMALFSGLLRDELATEPARLEMVLRIERELDYLQRVVTEFLDFARRSPPQLASVPVQALLNEVGEVLTGDAHAADVTLEVESEAVELHADGERLRRLLLNLGRNAIQACTRGGHVWLRCRRQQQQIVLEVQDNGCGIPEQLQQRVLEPFFTTRERGTGLGLALSRRIVEEHGGHLEITSAPGHGAIVRAVFPTRNRYEDYVVAR